ncbi:FecCD family ABC transporter permease [Pseudonocardia sp. GCM10023141]|uniref:FecCD family ABC transporter permease n=1 Tax=Pseudonocardia sp. GCM10023141 TaxID=3252653 RepID=UPI00361DC0D6
MTQSAAAGSAHRVDPAQPAALSPRRARSLPGRAVILVVLAAVLVLGLGLSLRVGSLTVSWREAWDAIFAYPGDDQATNGEIVVRTLRVTRTIAGFAAGVSLGVTGVLMQGLTRNPLADPGILGITAGAALAISATVVLGHAGVTTYIWFAFVGAAVAGVLVYVLGSLGGGATPVKLALAGAIVTAFAGALSSAFGVISPSVVEVGRFWSAGSIATIDPNNVAAVAPFLAVGLVLAMGTGRMLNGLALGDEIARSLGQRVGTTRAVVSLAVILLAGGATALAGPIAFLGLMVPHAARFLVGPDYRWIVPTAVLLGPCVLLLADVTGRIVAGASEIQVGIMTAVIGGPVFVFLVRRRVVGDL